jgi:hypothetical protein
VKEPAVALLGSIIVRLGTASALIILCSCGQSPAKPNNTNQPISISDHFKPFALGQDFQTATALGKKWSKESYERCISNVVVSGCVLDSEPNRADIFQDGVPYKISLGFNRVGKLDEITREYAGNAAIGLSQCTMLHDRMVDSLFAKIGPMYAINESLKPQAILEGWNSADHTTPAGHHVGQFVRPGVAVSFHIMVGSGGAKLSVASPDAVKGPFVQTMAAWALTEDGSYCTISYRLKDNALRGAAH